MSSEFQPGEKSVQLAGVAAFVRQLTHDLHNDLNALDLEATYIGELVENVSAKEELASQRETIHRMSRLLHKLSLQIQQPQPEKMRVSSEELLGEFRERLSRSNPSELSALFWTSAVGSSQLTVDFGMICNVLTELLKNALQYRADDAPVSFAATVQGQELFLAFSEKMDGIPEQIDRLGHEPFVTVRRRNYGLGLFYADQVARVHRGRLETRYDATDGLFIATLVLPLAN